MKELLAVLLCVSLVLVGGSPALAQSGPIGNNGDTPVHRLFLPSVSGAFSASISVEQGAQDTTLQKLALIKAFIASTGLGTYWERGSVHYAFFSEVDVARMTSAQRDQLADYGLRLPLKHAELEAVQVTQFNCEYGDDAFNQWYLGAGTSLQDQWTWINGLDGRLHSENFNYFLAPQSGFLTSWFLQAAYYNAPEYNTWFMTGAGFYGGGSCV